MERFFGAGFKTKRFGALETNAGDRIPLERKVVDFDSGL
jgi:hypothetical protein